MSYWRMALLNEGEVNYWTIVLLLASFAAAIILIVLVCSKIANRITSRKTARQKSQRPITLISLKGGKNR